MNLLIRKASPKELSQIVALENHIFGFSYTADYFESFFRQESLLVAFDQDVLIGCLGYFNHEDFIEIIMVGVKPTATRQGVGSMLMKAAISQALIKGAQAVFVEVRASNEAALKLYEQLNFKLVRKRENYYQSPSEDALEMRLSL